MHNNAGKTTMACGRWMLTGLACVVVLGSTWPARTAPAGFTVGIHPDGSIAAPVGALLSRAGVAEAEKPVRLHFGLPHQRPERQWRENDTLPICHSRWETNRIRYTQTVLLTRLEMDDPKFLGPTGSNAVLLVQISGENLAGEYTDASAALAVQVGDRWLDLELREGFVYAAAAQGPVLVAAVEIPPSGVEKTSGTQLHFRGHMPPGTSGSMTIKIPLAPLDQPEASNRLRDLEFDLELGQAKQFWKKHPDATPLAVTFADNKMPEPK